MVLVLLVLAAAAITPAVSKLKTNRALADFKNGLPGLAATARETAVTRGLAVDLQYDENSRQMQIVSPDSTSGTGTSTVNASGLSLPGQASTTPLVTVSLPTGLDATNFQAPPESTTSVAWSVRFYPDGTAAPAGIEFDINQDSYSLVIDANGGGKLVSGGIPDLTAGKWQAGDYVHRTQ